MHAYLPFRRGELTTGTGTPIGPSNLRKTIKRIGEGAGIEKLTPYALRHSANSFLAAAGVAPEVRGRIMGNSPRVNVEIYTHATTERVESAHVEAIGDLLS